MKKPKTDFTFRRLSPDAVKMLRETERRTNFIYTLVLMAVDLGIILHALFHGHSAFIRALSNLPVFLTTAAIIVNIILRKRTLPVIKYINFAVMLIAVLVLCLEQDTLYILLFVFPIFISVFYFNPRYTVITSAVSWVMLQIVLFNGISLNAAKVDELSYSDVPSLISDAFDFSKINELSLWEYRITSLIIISVIMGVCVYVSFSGRRFYQKQAELIRKNASTQMELNLAQGIQKGILAGNFPDTKCCGVYADMTPADEVGGDFYDWFPVDETHLAIAVGDVSGHGIPAAMFMALTKTLIKVYAQGKFSPEKVLERTNRYLVRSNPEKFFVTAWLGVLDLSTGSLSYANAGHNYPVIIRGNSDPEFFKTKPNFVLGRKRLVKYMEHRVKLTPGDKLVLYTDGVTEAKSPEGLFFEDDRLLSVLKAAKNMNQIQIVKAVRESLDEFEHGTDHYDDATILALYYKAKHTPPAPQSKVFLLNKNTFDDALDYIKGCCVKAGCDDMTVNSITVSSSEILANIDSYAYEDGGDVEIFSKCIRRRMIVEFKDSGRAFNPLLVSEPDTTLKLSERKPGGLGVFIVKKLMTDVSYEYRDGHNILRIEKEF